MSLIQPTKGQGVSPKLNLIFMLSHPSTSSISAVNGNSNSNAIANTIDGADADCDGKRDLKHLLYQSQLLTAKITHHLPLLNRGIDQIAAASDRLLASERNRECLARCTTSGISIGFDMEREIDGLAIHSRTPEEIGRVTERGEQRAVSEEAHRRFESLVDGMIDSVYRERYAKAESVVTEMMDARMAELWAKRKQKLLDELVSPLVDKQIVQAAPMAEKRAQAYAKVVIELNETRARKGGNFDLARHFYENVSPHLDSPQLVDAWDFCRDLLLSTGDADVFSAPSVTSLEDCQRKTVLKARAFLERLFLRFIDRTIAHFPRDAMAGGRPAIVDRVRAFVNVVQRRIPENVRLECDSGVPVFALTLYLVRVGQWNEAVAVARASLDKFGSLAAHMAAFLENGFELPAAARAQLQSEYAQRAVLADQDPFRLALMKIIGRCDLRRKSAHPLITQTTEDYVWLQLWLATASSGPSSAEYTLRDLQRLVTGFGPKHFANELLYLQVLLWTAQPERAIAYLYVQPYRTDAIHLAICYAYHRALAIAPGTECRVGEMAVEEENSGILTRVGDGYAVLFGKLVSRYAQQLASVDRSLAMHYALLQTLADDHVDLLPFVNASGDYEYWFGRIRADGTRESGKLDPYRDLLRQPIERLIEAAADKAGTVADQIHLLSLAGRWEHILNLLIERLLKDDSEAMPLMQSILTFYSTAHIAADAALVEEARSAIYIYTFKQKAKCGACADALLIAEERFFDPLSKSIRLPLRFHRTHLLGLFDQYLQCLHSDFKSHKRYARDDKGRQAAMSKHVEKARAVLVMLAKLQDERAPLSGYAGLALVAPEEVARLSKLANQIV